MSEQESNEFSKEFKEVKSQPNFVFSNKPVPTEKKKQHTGKGSRVIVPFFCGVLGATLVIGTCFGVPGIRNALIGTNTSPKTSINNLQNSSSTTLNPTQISLTNLSETGIGVATKVLPSIVGIKVEYAVNSIFYNNASTASAEGSGIIISEDGYILTNNHVVNSTSTSSFYEIGKATSIKVVLYNDETEYEAKIVGTDSQTDLAVIKIEKEGLSAAELGDSDSVQVGEFAMAIGNPLGLQSSVTGGFISAINRTITDSDGKKFTLIQTDAAINSGNSGGALVNSQGQVIGVNTIKYAGDGIEGMGFAIPINSTTSIIEQLIEYNKVKRPYMGISGIDLDAQTASRNRLVVGVYVRSVEDFSAAQKADIRAGDVITKADAQTITTMQELTEIKNQHAIGDEMKITLNRNGSEKEVTVTLTEQPDE